MHIIPEKYIGLLGFVPITLGIKEFICSVRSDKNAAKERLIGYLDSSKNNNLLFSAVTLSVSNGADNIVCHTGIDDRKALLFDDFNCWDEGCLIGKVSPETISQLPKCN